MKGKVKKIIALCMCVLLTVGVISVTAYAINEKKYASSASGADKAAQSLDGKISGVQEADAGVSTAASADEGEAYYKDETVYVLAGADGSISKIIVSDWLKNSTGSQTINDKTELTDVENVKGSESFTVGSGNACVWDAQGGDIFYQGNADKELPVGLTVTYKLDGKTVTPEELAGKSGKVTIRFDYDNRQFENVTVGEKEEKIYVPFAMLTGVIIDNSVFRNVEVTNGKLINDGSRTAVIGIAFPGLQEDLAIPSDELEIPDYVEITGDAEDFKLGMTVTLATNEVFNEIDTESFDSADELFNAMSELTDGMKQLLDGSSQLYDGLAVLLEKSGELADGIDKLASGAESLKDGANDLDLGAAQLQAGAKQLEEGLNTLVSNNEELNGGAKQVFDTLLSTANTQLAAAGLEVPKLTTDNYAKVLDGVIASLDKNAVYEKALAEVTAAVEQKRSYIESQVSAAVMQEVSTQVSEAVRAQVALQVKDAVNVTVAESVIQAAAHMSKADYDAAVSAGLVDKATQAAIEDAVSLQMQSEQIQQTVEAKINEQMSSESVKGIISATVNEKMQSAEIKETVAANTELQIKKAISDNMASEEVQSQLAAASEGAKSVINLKMSLDSYNTFYLGLKAYTDGAAQAADGAKELKTGTDALKDGASALSSGASELYNGILTLKDGVPELTDGVSKLCDGAMQLSDGLKKFNEEGIQKLSEFVDGDLNALITRLRAIHSVSLNYKNFAGIADGADGKVKFIYRTDAVEQSSQN